MTMTLLDPASRADNNRTPSRDIRDTWSVANRGRCRAVHAKGRWGIREIELDPTLEQVSQDARDVQTIIEMVSRTCSDRVPADQAKHRC